MCGIQLIPHIIFTTFLNMCLEMNKTVIVCLIYIWDRKTEWKSKVFHICSWYYHILIHHYIMCVLLFSCHAIRAFNLCNAHKTLRHSEFISEFSLTIKNLNKVKNRRLLKHTDCFISMARYWPQALSSALSNLMTVAIRLLAGNATVSQILV